MYVICRTCPSTLCKTFLNTEHKFVVATNNAHKFISPKAASQWYMNRDCPVHVCGSGVWIEGPRGGGYLIHNGK